LRQLVESGSCANLSRRSRGEEELSRSDSTGESRAIQTVSVWARSTRDVSPTTVVNNTHAERVSRVRTHLEYGKNEGESVERTAFRRAHVLSVDFVSPKTLSCVVLTLFHLTCHPIALPHGEVSAHQGVNAVWQAVRN
jgi:hypothetical protein